MKYIFPAGDLFRGHPAGRLHLKQKKIFLLPFVKQQSRLNLLAVQTVAQDEVPVSRRMSQKGPV